MGFTYNHAQIQAFADDLDSQGRVIGTETESLNTAKTTLANDPDAGESAYAQAYVEKVNSLVTELEDTQQLLNKLAQTVRSSSGDMASEDKKAGANIGGA